MPKKIWFGWLIVWAGLAEAQGLNCLNCNATFYCEGEEGCFCFHENGERNICQYAKKQQKTAFLLSIFTGMTGADRYYMENLSPAIAKTVLFGMSLMGVGFGVKYWKTSKSWLHGKWSKGLMGTGFVLGYMSASAVFLWWLVDAIYFGMNQIPDGNGILPQPW